MFNRSLAAVFSFCLIGALAVPLETSARGLAGGRGAAPRGIAPPAARPHVVAPRPSPVVPRALGGTLVAPKTTFIARKPFVLPKTAAAPRFGLTRPTLVRRHHRVYGFGLPYGGYGAPYYEPSDPRVIVVQQPPPEAPEPLDPLLGPVTAEPLPRGYPVAYPVAFGVRGCSSQAVTVPAERGGERRVTIVRC